MTTPDAGQPLRVFDADLTETSLVEASAGTGKTYTITGLFVRMIAEGVQTVDRILVVTYTKAATAELRDRIRRALAGALKVLRSGEHDGDAFSRELLAQDLDREACLRRVENAVLGFDLAPVFTIHGFCQRALADHAFESGSAFDTEMLPDESDLLLEVVRDFYRREFYAAPGAFVAYARDFGPGELLRWVQPHLAKPYLEVRVPGPVPDEHARERAFREALDAVRTLWETGGGEVTDLLLNSGALNGNKYRKASIPGWIAQLTGYLGAASPGVKLPEKFVKFTTREIASSLNKGAEPPAHPFFDACEMLEAAASGLEAAYEVRLARLRAALIADVNETLAQRKRRLRLQSFNDLLLDLQNALDGPSGEALASTLRRRYGAALIDEFQDTDPIQYAIFHRIWQGTGLPVFFVGDPKQAIYSFRGADVFTYLRGRDDAGRVYTLRENWRSTPGLIDAANALFGAVRDPFVLPQIGYPEAVPAPKARDELVDPDSDGAPFRFWFVGDRDDGKPWSKEQAREKATQATVAGIARLVDAGARGEARIGERALNGGDIAVLVRSHREASQVGDALAAWGIPSVEQSQDSVYESREAMELERLLAAIAEPSREDRVAAALTTTLLGVGGDTLFDLRRDARGWETRLSAFHDWRQRWRRSGFVRMMYHLMRVEGVAGRLLARPGGARALTNLRHLVELLHGEARRRRGIEDLLRWFAERRRAGAVSGEEAQIRLENDGNLVKLVTVHKSKGLQYPVVFCPFVWDGGLRNVTGNTACHDPERDNVPVLDLRGGSTAANIAVEREELAENLRLLYVALTRAEHRCHVVWGQVSGAEQSPLAWLLHPVEVGKGDSVAKAMQSGFAGLDEHALFARLGCLVEEAPGAFSVERIESLPIRENDGTAAESRPELKARRFNRTLRPGAVVTSFSALTVGGDAEAPDHDAGIVYPRDTIIEHESRTIFDFPRGARAGVCLHKIFERLDFSDTDPAAATALVERTLIAYGFDPSWVPVVEGMIRRVLRAPLDAGGQFRLAGISPDRRLDELEFHYPISPVEVAELRRMARGGPTGGRSITATATGGFMKGFIDLVFESGGRYYVVDYKSNWLGSDLDDYRRKRLEIAITGHDYDLQYLIYTVALHRLLRTRIPEYDYETHFGGVAYLFLRGIDPDTDPDSGVFRDRPNPGLVASLDRYLGAERNDPSC
ncbi:MAG: exodeoxyribonuclease V subunit beta [Pseudomonadota bacterium]|nr:exodeoxyribonuclease V subunit beta [Pseudomonadota bacterium]